MLLDFVLRKVAHMEAILLSSRLLKVNLGYGTDSCLSHDVRLSS